MVRTSEKRDNIKDPNVALLLLYDFYDPEMAIGGQEKARQDEDKIAFYSGYRLQYKNISLSTTEKALHM